MKIKVGYNKLIVSLPVALAGILATLSFMASQKGVEVSGENFFLIVGLLVLSVPMYFLPYIVVTDTEIWVNNQFGMPRRRAKISSLSDIRFESGAIFVKTEDYERKLHFSKIMVDIKALKELKKKVEGLQ